MQRPAQVPRLCGGVHARRRRIMLYSHDTMGLGHMRRNLLIAQTLAGSPLQPAILMVCGAREVHAFPLPSGVDCVTLPALHKDDHGHYQSRYLDLSLQHLITLRAKTIHAACDAFEPDVLLVDNVPRGAMRELDLTLEYLRTHGHARCVLGLRDILDDPAVVRREWSRGANEDAIIHYYDAVWVYGDQNVYDLVRENHFCSDVAAKVHYTGYLGQQKLASYAERRRACAPFALPQKPIALCLVGGGQDGARLAEAFAQAELPAETYGVILTGPYMPSDVQQRLRSRAAQRSDLGVFDFIPEPAVLLSRAHRIVAMGGYNTTCEILSSGKRPLLVPRVHPRREQLIRAEHLRNLGAVDLLHPDEVTPRALTEWLARDMEPPAQGGSRINLNGLTRLPGLLEAVLAGVPHSA